jgi:hypothetical protein
MGWVVSFTFFRFYPCIQRIGGYLDAAGKRTISATAGNRNPVPRVDNRGATAVLTIRVGHLLTIVLSDRGLQEVFNCTARNRSGKTAEQRGKLVLVFRPAPPVTLNVKNLKLSLCLIT